MPERPRPFRSGCLLAALCAACSSGEAPSASGSATVSSRASSGLVLEAAENVGSAAASSSAKAAADPIVAIPAGKLIAGSTPGDQGRDPTLEPALVPFSLNAFDIDRFVYPNDTSKPPLRGATREKAASLCKERGRRLCTELEWEHACKSEADQLFAGRASWDAACSKDPTSCASGFGVLGMGAAREWTASDVAAVADVKGGAAVRGAPSTASDADRRCAHRASVPADASGSSDIVFRCCGGDANEAAITPPEKRPVFERAELPASELGEMFGVIPQLSKLKGDVLYFESEAAAKEVTAKADAGVDPKGYELTTLPLSWRPIAGEDLVVVTGIAGDDSFVVALYKLPDGRHRVASSLVLKKDKGPVVLAYDRSVDTRLEWSTCWQCRGESGRITYRDDRRVVITQE